MEKTQADTNDNRKKVKEKKPYRIAAMWKGKVKKSVPCEGLLGDCNEADVKEEALTILKNKGAVYGVYVGKKLVGLYLFERIENFFVQQNEKLSELAEFLQLHNCTDALCMKKGFLSVDLQAYEEQLQQDICKLLEADISEGAFAGVLWGEQLRYRKDLQSKNKSLWQISGALIGFALGYVIGQMIFDSVSLGICFGISYAILWGGVGVTCISSKTVWEKYDFVNEKYRVSGEKEE